MAHIPDQIGPGEVDRAPAQHEALELRAVNIRELVKRYGLAYPPALALEDIVLDDVPAQIGIVIAKRETGHDKDHRHMPVAQVYVPGNPMPVDLQHLPGMALYVRRKPDGGWANERDRLRLLGQRALELAEDGYDPRADLFVMPIQGAPDEDGVLLETAVQGMPMSRMNGRIRLALDYGFITPDEAGRMLGLMYDSAVETIYTLVELYGVIHGHAHPPNCHVWQGITRLCDLTWAGDAAEDGRSLTEIAAAEAAYFTQEWRKELEHPEIKLDQLPIVSSHGLSPEEHLALAVRLDEISAQVALKLAGIPNPTPEAARLTMDTVSRMAARIIYRSGPRQAGQAADAL